MRRSMSFSGDDMSLRDNRGLLVQRAPSPGASPGLSREP